MESDLELDCRGRRYPLRIMELARHVGDIEVGQVLAVVAEDPAARPDVQAWCRMRAQEYLGEDLTDDEVPRFFVRRLS